MRARSDHPGAMVAGQPPGRRVSTSGPMTVALLLSFGFGGCGGGEVPVDPSRAFLDNLSAACGQAFPGGLVLEPEGDEMLTGRERLVAHIRHCTPEEVQIAFHIELEADGYEGAAGDRGAGRAAPHPWDRSRTWFVLLGEAGLELRHDHREPDGRESRRTWYGGTALGSGTPNRQDFASPERTAAAGVPVGWRIEIEPGAHYRYGTTFDGSYDWMIEFDLSTPLLELPPEAWGADRPPSRIPGPP